MSWFSLHMSAQRTLVCISLSLNLLSWPGMLRGGTYTLGSQTRVFTIEQCLFHHGPCVCVCVCMCVCVCAQNTYTQMRQRLCYSASRPCVICALVGASQPVDSATQPVVCLFVCLFHMSTMRLSIILYIYIYLYIYIMLTMPHRSDCALSNLAPWMYKRAFGALNLSSAS